jgi:ABC-type lipoprotein release transport system permease subunit
LRKGYFPDLEFSRFVRDSQDITASIAALPAVKAVAPRINGGGLISKDSQTFGGLVLGIDPEREAAFSRLDQTIRAGKYLAADDRDGVLVGQDLAANLNATLGDTLVFMGQGADGSIAADTLIIRGLFKRGVAELDRGMIAAHIDTVGEAFSLYGGVSEIAVLLHADQDRAATGIAIQDLLAERDDLEVLDWKTLLPGIEQSIQMDWVSGLIMYGLLVMVVGFGIANTFLMTYLERVREFGTLMAIGMKPVQVALMNYLEAALLSVLGVGVGLLLGTPLVTYYQKQGITFDVSEEMLAQYGMDATIHPLLSAEVYQWTLSIVLGIALLIALLPAIKILRLKPVEAMRA